MFYSHSYIFPQTIECISHLLFRCCMCVCHMLLKYYLLTYLPLFQIFRRSSHLLSLCNFLIRSYQSSTFIVLHLRPVILNHSLSSSMTSVLFSPPLQPHPMNLSPPVTLTFISIILQTHSPLSFCLFSFQSQSTCQQLPYARQKSLS